MESHDGNLNWITLELKIVSSSSKNPGLFGRPVTHSTVAPPSGRAATLLDRWVNIEVALYECYTWRSSTEALFSVISLHIDPRRIMSGMLGWITGNSAQKRKAAPKDAIVALRAHLEMLQKREIHLQNQMDEQQAIARKNISSNKAGQ